MKGRRHIPYVKAGCPMTLSSTHEIGVAFSAAPVMLCQGSIALPASLSQWFLGKAAVAQPRCARGILLMEIGLNMVGWPRAAVRNLLPAVPVAAIVALVGRRSGWRDGRR